MISTSAVDVQTVSFGAVRMGLGAAITRLGPLCTKYNSPPIQRPMTDHHRSIMSLTVGEYDNKTTRS